MVSASPTPHAVPLASIADLAALARTNMVESQIRTNRVTEERLLAALASVPRERFVPESLQRVAYVDEALRLKPGRFLVEPLLLARLLQTAEIGASDRVLIVGAGTGYSAAIVAALADRVVALESDADLADAARRNAAALGLAGVGIVSGPLTEGWSAGAAYDVVLIDGTVAEIPDPIVEQLVEGGRLVTVTSTDGRCGCGMLFTKRHGLLSKRVLFDGLSPFLPGFEPRTAFVL